MARRKCWLEIGVNDQGPYVKFTNNNKTQVTINPSFHEIEALWKSMSRQLGMKYESPNWARLDAKAEFTHKKD